MKVVAFNGSPRKEGNTYHALRMVAQELEKEGIEVEIIHIGGQPVRGCMGCNMCARNRYEKCVLEGDDLNLWVQKMKEADGVLFGSPVHFAGMSAAMKAFLDLSFTNWMSHKPHECMFSKRAVVISTAAGAGAKKAAKLVAVNLRNWGIPYIKTFGISVNATDWDTAPEKKRRKMERSMSSLGGSLSKERGVRVGIRTRMMFIRNSRL